MKSKYKYIRFERTDDGVRNRQTSVWSCKNKKSGIELGVVKWHGGWRQYCYFPTVQAVYSSGCLVDIVDFIKQLEAERCQH